MVTEQSTTLMSAKAVEDMCDDILLRIWRRKIKAYRKILTKSKRGKFGRVFTVKQARQRLDRNELFEARVLFERQVIVAKHLKKLASMSVTGNVEVTAEDLSWISY